MATKEYMKIYNQRPERKMKKRIEGKEWYKKNKENLKIIRGKLKEKKRLYDKIHKSTQRYKVRRNREGRQRRKEDLNYNVQCLLSRAFFGTMKQFSTTGKTKPKRIYGIDVTACIKKLGKHPNDGRTYEIDYIIPRSKFNHNDPEQIKKCWNPENLQWLTKEINNWKGARLIKPLTDEQKEKLQQQLKDYKEVKYKMANRDGTGPREGSYRKEVEDKQEGRRIEAGEECPAE